MKNKKYELTENTITFNGVKLHQIRALRDVANCNEGELGGFIEKEENLSQEDECWVARKAKVFGNALISDDALVTDKAMVFDKVRIMQNAIVCDNAVVYNNATVLGHAKLCMDASVYEHSVINDNAYISGMAKIHGHAKIMNDARIFGNAEIMGETLISGSMWVTGNIIINYSDKQFGTVDNFNGSIYLSNDSIISSSKDIFIVKGLPILDIDIVFVKSKNNEIKVSINEGFCGKFEDAIEYLKNSKLFSMDSNHDKELIESMNYLNKIAEIKFKERD